MGDRRARRRRLAARSTAARCRRARPTDPDAVVDAASAAIGAARRWPAGRAIASVGIGVPGPVRPGDRHDPVPRQRARATGRPAGRATPVGAALGLPVALINDARAFGLAELRLGAGRGVAVDGRADARHRGRRRHRDRRPVSRATTGRAGELGHQTIDPDGPDRATAATTAASRRSPGRTGSPRRAARRPPRRPSSAARAGDARALAGLARVGRYLGIGIANMIVVVSPDRVVIGGGVAAAGDLLLEPIRAEIRRRVRTTSLAEVDDRPGRARHAGPGAIGAAVHGAEQAGLRVTAHRGRSTGRLRARRRRRAGGRIDGRRRPDRSGRAWSRGARGRRRSVCSVAPGFVDVHVHGWGGHDAMGDERGPRRDGPGAAAARRDALPADGRDRAARRRWIGSPSGSGRGCRRAPADGAEPLGFNLEGPFLVGRAAGRPRPGAPAWRRPTSPPDVIEPLLDGLAADDDRAELPGAPGAHRAAGRARRRGVARPLGGDAGRGAGRLRGGRTLDDPPVQRDERRRPPGARARGRGARGRRRLRRAHRRRPPRPPGAVAAHRPARSPPTG